jgi:hypothetical protein
MGAYAGVTHLTDRPLGELACGRVVLVRCNRSQEPAHVTCKACRKLLPASGPYAVRMYRRHDVNGASAWYKVVDSSGRTVRSGFSNEDAADIACFVLNSPEAK